ncbi:MAG: efflux RND transporter permease subunit [Phycisphaerae bacterium]|nr:efflux RND transporter permease subunit [Phycisphaerae bacterium]
MLISNTAIRNRTTVLVLMVMIIVAGVTAYITLPREAAPDIKVPFIIITTANPGMSPNDVENEITNEIEQKLSGLKGMKEMKSTSAEGMSTIFVEFLPEVNIDDALQRVKDKVDQAKSELPKNTDDPVEPIVKEISFTDRPIMMISMSGPISPVRIKAIAEKLEDELEVIPGVLEVDVRGALEREIIIEIDPDRFAQYHLCMEELFQSITAGNITRTAGGLETAGTKFNVRIPAEITEPDELDKFPIARRGNRQIYLSDVATIKDTFKDRTTISRLDGQSSVTIAIKKRVGANIVDIARHVKAILAEARKQVPAGVKFELTYDDSKQIDMMVMDLENNIMTGLVLVVIVLILFMGFRSSIIVAMAIPLSMLMSFAILQLMGITLNMVVLFSLILALGMLVDNAIVIVENIYRYAEQGYSRIDAAMKGTGEVAWPVIASTATTVAAFAPLLFWPDIMGEFMSYIPLTAIVVLSSSLVVAMVITPVICSVFTKPGKRKETGKRDHWFITHYRKLLHVSLEHPMTTVLISLCMLAAIGIIYVRRGRGHELFPEMDPDQAVVDIRAPQGTNINETDRIARLVEQKIMPLRRNSAGFAQYDNLVTNVGIGGGTGFPGSSGGGGVHTGSLTIVFPDYEIRQRPSADVIKEMRKDIGDIAGAEIKLEKQKEGPPTGAAVTIRVIGKDMKILKKLSDEIKRSIENVPNLVNLQSDLEAEKPELAFVPDRERAGLLGVNTREVSDFLKAAIFGTKISTYREFNDEYDIRIRTPLSQRNQLDDLSRWRVPSGNGEAVPISSLGHFEYRPGLGTIHRVNRKRMVTLTGDAEGRLGPAVLKDVQKSLAELELPAGYYLEYAGEKEEQDKAKAFLTKAFTLAILLIIGILVAQFNTLSVPLIIMTTVLLSMIGVFVGLLVFDMPFGIVMTGVGVISLAGVVVNNAIVLLDYTRKLQRRGHSLMVAAVEAGVTRLRPVLLTATTTILGLIPMVTGVSFDFHVMRWATRSSSSQWWSSMAVAVVFGLGFATMLTLLVVPSLYVMLYRLAERVGLGGLQKPEDLAHAKEKPILEDF